MSVFISSLPVIIIGRLLLAILLGGLVGLERELHGRPAGLRTHILVCMGATMIMISPELFANMVNGQEMAEWIRIDPGRVVAGIVTGIGFLGAGAIIRMGDIVRGLTTAASIWFTAALGVVIGGGHFFLAVVATALSLIVLSLFDRMEHLIATTMYRRVIVNVSQESVDLLDTRAEEILNERSIRIQEKKYTWDKEKKEMEITFQVRAKNVRLSRLVVLALGDLEGVKSVRWE